MFCIKLLKSGMKSLKVGSDSVKATGCPENTYQNPQIIKIAEGNKYTYGNDNDEIRVCRF